jgi:phenylpropionate dioxygenase-like ring-hydroxylating dioxygenase large terminal subunit
MPKLIPNARENLDVLSDFWHPVAFEKDVAADKPATVRILGKDLVLYRTGTSIVAAEDRCPHRGARLSLGHVSHGDLVCTYHGLKFGKAGRCENLRQRCEGTKYRDLSLATLRCDTKYGIIWVCLSAQSNYKIPDFPEYYDSSYATIFLPSFEWKASPIRQIEGVFDLTHFAYVHHASGCSMLGARDARDIPAYTINTKRHMIHVDFRSESGPATGFWARTYKITLPFTVQMSARRTPDGFWILFNTVCPVTENISKIFVVQAFNFNKAAISESMGTYEEMVYREDQRVVESQTPVIPDLLFRDEFSLPEDRISIAYRKALRRIGLR